MSIETFFQVCQDGNVERLREQLETDVNLDLNAKDAHGMSALAYGARNGHIEVVRELLARGAEKTEVLEQGYGHNNPDITTLLSDGEAQQHTQPEEGNGDGYVTSPGLPVDMHGGQQMPDGTISYLNAASNFGQGFPVVPQFGGPQYPPHFFPEGVHAPNFQPGMGRRGQHHGRKESNVNLPPPEIARMIPCKYFPNCKYGDKCVFAHPPLGMPGPHQGHPLSPSMSRPHMQPIFYQQLPPGYPYPPYGAAPHQFIPMGPPNPMQQYGMPQHFGQPVVQPQQQLSPSIAVPETQGEVGGEGMQAILPNVDVGQPELTDEYQAMLPLPTATEAAPGPEQGAQQAQVSSQTVDVGAADDTPALSLTEAGQTQGKEDVSAQQEEQEATGKPVHRRQSFNSFLHRHAVPFQPQAVPVDGSAMLNGTTFTPRSAQNGGKARRVGAVAGGGANGYNSKRNSNNGERPPCTFFQAGRCKYGDECRFPHFLADGTDARPMQAQQRQMYAAQYAAANGAAVRAATNGGNHTAPASAPTAPQADKRAQQQQQSQQNQQQQQQPQQQQSQQPPQPPQPQQQQQPNGKGGKSAQGNGVVRSNPSKTTQAAAAAAAKGSGKKQNQQNQQNQHQQNQQTSQRVPTVNDFPALSSPGLNGHSSATSPSSAPAVSANVASAQSQGDAVAVTKSPNATPAVPKVNFSAILSAPAPAKPKTAIEMSTSNGTSSHENTSDSGGEETSKADAAEIKSPNGKTHATAAASAPATTNGASAAAKPQPKVNGKEKQRQPNAAQKEGKAPNSYKAAAAAPVPKASGNGTPTAEDDFQLVNRSRSTSKRPSHGKGDGYTPQAKAVAA